MPMPKAARATAAWKWRPRHARRRPPPARPNRVGEQAATAASAHAVRARFIDAMARRAAMQQGSAHALLEARVAALRAAHEAAGAPTDTTLPAQPQRGPLAALTDQLTQYAAAQARHTSVGSGPAELQALPYFRATWSRLSAQRRLAQSLAQLPENAGPLNSHRLVHRALTLMRQLSPDYLQRFMAHVDVLMWLEQAQAKAAPVAAGKEAPRGKAAAKKARGKAG